MAIVILRPGSDASFTDWSPSSGSDHYAMVDDVTIDYDTTYSTENGDASFDSFGAASSIPVGATINSIKAVGWFRGNFVGEDNDFNFFLATNYPTNSIDQGATHNQTANDTWELFEDSAWYGDWLNIDNMNNSRF